MNTPDAYPLSWPLARPRTPRHQVTASAFGKHSFAEARDELLRQLDRLRAANIILSTNVPLRRDGLPSGSIGSPVDAAVAVYFKLRGKPMVFACDRWTKVEHNLWAIARTIEAQRGVTRWGSVEVEQAFAGYAALPAPSSPAENCWTVLCLQPNAPADAINAQYRMLGQRRHPDRGGSHEAMAALNRAREEALAAVKEAA